MTKSEKFLMEAFAGESQANRKYLAFAKQAERMASPGGQALPGRGGSRDRACPRPSADGGGVKTTAENLKAAIAGETHEFEHMYPEMIAAAQAEGNKAAERSFSYANEVEKIHAGLYQKALANLDKKAADVDYYVCSVCGYTCEDHPPEKCPVCNSGAKAFSKVD